MPSFSDFKTTNIDTDPPLINVIPIIYLRNKHMNQKKFKGYTPGTNLSSLFFTSAYKNVSGRAIKGGRRKESGELIGDEKSTLNLTKPILGPKKSML